MTVADWMLTILLVSIPIVGIVLMIIWACGVGNTTRVNFCRALLMWVGILILISIIMKIGFFSELSYTISKWIK